MNKLAFSTTISLSSFIIIVSKTMQDTAIVTMENESELVCDLSNGAISTDLAFGF